MMEPPNLPKWIGLIESQKLGLSMTALAHIQGDYFKARYEYLLATAKSEEHWHEGAPGTDDDGGYRCEICQAIAHLEANK